MSGGPNDRLLDIQGLQTHFFTDRGVVRAVDGVDLWVDRREILGVVGESGCGKTMMARSILRIVPKPGRIVGGRIELEGTDLLRLSGPQMRRVRGDAVSMIFQEPMVSLDPVYTVGNQIGEILATHRRELGRAERQERIVEILRLVGIPSPERRIRSYPHELSGGMRQRVMIAMALACGAPRLVIADEPTTALDVTIQAQILDLFKKLQQDIGMSVIMITHDLGVVAETANRVAVMYAGSVVEQAGVRELFANPLHPYTRGLIRSLPRRGRDARKGRLYTIAGTVPHLLELEPGCKFYDRCPYARADICRPTEPALEEFGGDHRVRCRRARELGDDDGTAGA
jgi:oligopeptide/dipeptide ABC transporter ATP-binding protein